MFSQSDHPNNGNNRNVPNQQPHQQQQQNHQQQQPTFKPQPQVRPTGAIEIYTFPENVYSIYYEIIFRFDTFRYMLKVVMSP